MRFVVLVISVRGKNMNNLKIDEIKTISKKRLELFEDDKILERRRTIRYKNRPDKWIVDILEGRK